VRALDRFLQRRRAAVAERWIPSGARLLDVGCYDHTLLARVRGRVARATGIDPAATPRREGNLEIVRGRVPGEPRLPAAGFDCVSALAVVEHVGDPQAFAREIFRLLAPGGRAVLTAPHPLVDRILDALILLRLADGMDAQAHHGFDVGRLVPVFQAAGFSLVARRRFQLGLNHLFVFAKPAASGEVKSGDGPRFN